MITEIAVQQGLAAWDQRATLDGVDYLLSFAWNGRDGAWYMSIRDTSGNDILTGIKLVSNRPLLQRFHYLVGVPAGEISAVSLDSSIDFAQFGDLGVSVLLYYFDAAEVASASA